MSYTTYIEQALNKDTKTCTKCGIDKPLAEFPEHRGKYHSHCKACGASAYVHCGHCHTKRKEAKMLYVVRTDNIKDGKDMGYYFCNQKCLTRMRCG